MLVDILVYFPGTNITKKTYICNKAKTMKTSDLQSLDLSVVSSTVTNYGELLNATKSNFS